MRHLGGLRSRTRTVETSGKAAVALVRPVAFVTGWTRVTALIASECEGNRRRKPTTRYLLRTTLEVIGLAAQGRLQPLCHAVLADAVNNVVGYGLHLVRGVVDGHEGPDVGTNGQVVA